MSKIRVLVVDDSVVVRRLVSNVLAEDPNIEVVGSAANGRIALSKIPQVNPDIITLDIEMPEMDGLETIREIRKTWVDLPVIMFSTLTERGATATLEALSRGATDYVTKPSNVGSVDISMQRIRDELIPKIKALCGSVSDSTAAPATVATRAGGAPPVTRVRSGIPPAIKVLMIASSTGGPNALAQVIPLLPADFPVPIVIAQHMPPMFTRFLAERLAVKSGIEVREGEAGAVLEPGHAWVAPGDYHMTIKRDGQQVRLDTNQNPPENSVRPAADVLFRSVVEVYSAHVLAVVLTGMGQDGLRGCEKVAAAGGRILVQDEATSIVWGMPGFVANAGLADKILPLNQIANEIVSCVVGSRQASNATKAFG